MKSRKKPVNKAAELFDAAVAARVHGEEPDWPEWLDEEDLMDLLELSHIARSFKMAYDAVRREMEDRAADMLGLGNSVTDGRTFYRVAPERTRHVNDPHLLVDWLDKALPDVIRVTGESVSIERFRQLAEQRYRDMHPGADDRQVKAAVRAFEEIMFRVEEHPGGRLTPIPLDSKYAPRYAQDMTPGEIRRPNSE